MSGPPAGRVSTHQAPLVGRFLDHGEVGRLGVGLEGRLVLVDLVEPDAVIVFGVLDRVEPQAPRLVVVGSLASTIRASSNSSRCPGEIGIVTITTFIFDTPLFDCHAGAGEWYPHYSGVATRLEAAARPSQRGWVKKAVAW